MAVVSAADIAPKAFEQLVREGGENQDVEDDLQVSLSAARLRDGLVQCCETVCLNMLVIGVTLSMAAGRLWLWRTYYCCYVVYSNSYKRRTARYFVQRRSS